MANMADAGVSKSHANNINSCGMWPPLSLPAAVARRKRDDDSSCSSATGIDSMRPVVAHRRKRRRTIVDAFQSISFREDDEDADSSQAVADLAVDGDGYSTTSSLEDDLEDDDSDERLLSDKEKAERKIMLELVFGPNSEFTRPSNPVDLKLQEMIRKTMLEVSVNKDYDTTLDDMHLDPSYSRASLPTAAVAAGRNMKRSNSLPNIAVAAEEDVEMDTTATP